MNRISTSRGTRAISATSGSATSAAAFPSSSVTLPSLLRLRIHSSATLTVIRSIQARSEPVPR